MPRRDWPFWVSGLAVEMSNFEDAGDFSGHSHLVVVFLPTSPLPYVLNLNLLINDHLNLANLSTSYTRYPPTRNRALSLGNNFFLNLGFICFLICFHNFSVNLPRISSIRQKRATNCRWTVFQHDCENYLTCLFAEILLPLSNCLQTRHGTLTDEC